MDAFSPDRAHLIEQALIQYVSERPPARRKTWVLGLLMSGALVGAGASAGAFAATGVLHAASAPGPEHPAGAPSDLPDAVAAPADVIPGAPIISMLGDPIVESFSAPTQVPLTPRPAGATHVRVAITPSTAGSLTWGTDPNGNNPSGSWADSDLAADRPTQAWYDIPLDASTDVLYLNPTGLTAIATVQFATYVPTRLGVNAKGQTYGVSSSTQGDPDLVAVSATNGQQGYVYREDLEDADGTNAAEKFTSPEDAMEWQERNRGVTHVMPVYEPDGETQIGEFRVG